MILFQTIDLRLRFCADCPVSQHWAKLDTEVVLLPHIWAAQLFQKYILVGGLELEPIRRAIWETAIYEKYNQMQFIFILLMN